MTHAGTYDELSASSALFAHLLQDIHQHELKEQQSIECQKQKSMLETAISASEDPTDASVSPTNVETKQQGVVKWHVYTAYMRAGVGLGVGLVLMTGIFSVRELIAIFSDRWLGNWNDDETHRYRVFNNCTMTSKNTILSMDRLDWEEHRDHRFYIYAGIVGSRPVWSTRGSI